MKRRTSIHFYVKVGVGALLTALITLLSMIFSCSTTPTSFESLKQKAEEVRIDAAAYDAARYCADDYRAGDALMAQAIKWREKGQTDYANSALRQAIQLYQNAALCGARARRQIQMPIPMPPEKK